MPRVDKSRGQNSGKEIRLIELIRENPELYDSGHPLYKDNNQKKIIWECLSEEMNTPVESLKKVWKKLRYNYMKKSRDLEVEKMAKTTPCDEALAFLMTSVMEYANENSPGNSQAISPRTVEDRTLRSSSQLTAIFEEDKSTATLVPEEPVDDPGGSGPPELAAVLPRENFGTTRTSDRVLRPRHSEPSRIASRESLKPRNIDGAPAGPRRLTTTPTTPGARAKNRKLILDPNDSTRIFFDSMAITVASFPQYLQATVKLQICKIVSETECDLSSPKIP